MEPNQCQIRGCPPQPHIHPPRPAAKPPRPNPPQLAENRPTKTTMETAIHLDRPDQTTFRAVPETVAYCANMSKWGAPDIATVSVWLAWPMRSTTPNQSPANRYCSPNNPTQDPTRLPDQFHGLTHPRVNSGKYRHSVRCPISGNGYAMR